MADTQENQPAPPPLPPGTPPRRRRRWLRVTLRVAVVAVVALLALLAAGPSLLSTRPVVKLVLSQVNRRLNGRVAVRSVSLGWTTGVKVDGLQVFDAADEQIAQADHVACPMPLWHAVTGSYPLGDTVIDGLAFDARYDAQGRLNFAQLVKAEPPPPAAPPPPPPSPAAKPFKLPDLSGDVQVKNARGTVSQPGKPTVYLTAFAAEVKIPGINQPITDHAEAAVRVGDAGPVGRLVADGTVSTIAGNQIDLNVANVHQTADVTGLDLAAVRSFAPPALGLDTLSGVLNVHAAADAMGGKTAVVTTTLTSAGPVAVGGRMLHGQTYTVDALDVALPKLTLTVASGLADWRAGTVVVAPSHVSLVRLFARKRLDHGGSVEAIAGDTVNLSLAGTVDLADLPAARLTELSLADSAHIVDIHKDAGDLSASGGQLAVMAELGSIDDIARLLMQQTAGPQPVGDRVRSGHLTGTLAFKAGPSGKAAITGQLDVPNLDVATTAGDAGPQRASVAVRGSFDPAAHAVTLDEVTLTSPFATAAVRDATVLLNAPSTVDQLQRATVAVDVPNLATLMALAKSFSAPPAKGAPPALDVTGGSISMRADVSHDGTNLAVHVPTLTATGVAFTRGPAKYAAAPITAKFDAALGTGPGPSLMAQLRGLRVTALDATTGVATVSMTTPITVADLSNPAASAAGGVKVDGELADLSTLLAALGGQPADAYPYRGHYTLTEDLTGGNGVAVKGGLTVANFKVMQGPAVQFAEDQLAVTNDLSMASDLNTAYLHAVTISMRSSGALDVSVTNGSVTDLAKTRALNLPVQLRYDLAKLWQVIHPMLLTPGKPDAYADVKLAGAFTKSLRVGGSYPAGQPFEQAVKQLQLDADLAVADFEHGGLVVKDLDLPVTLRNGVAVTAFPDGHAAPVATANDGQLDLGQLSVDLTQTPPRLTTPAAKAVLAHATINPLFAQTFLAKVVNNPVFAGAKEATGLIDLTIDDCQRLPLGDLVTQAVAGNDGTAHVRFSLTNLHVGLEGLGQLASALKQDSFAANIKDGTVAVARGISTQHVKFVTGSYTVSFDGNVRLADDTFAPMTVGLPMAVILRKGGAASADVLRYVPDVVSIPLRGKVSSPQLDVTSAAATNLRDAAIKAAAGMLGGNKGGGGNAGDAIGGFLKGLGKKH